MEPSCMHKQCRGHLWLTHQHLYDGSRKDAKPGRRDADFQTDASYIACYWEGLHGHHSTIKEYYISLGTCNICEDLIEHQAIGITEGM